MKISLCIPVYNEEEILPATLKTVSEYMSGEFGDECEIIYINDGSRDRSADIITQYSAAYDSRVRLLGYEVNRGKGYAVRTGMLGAKGDIIIFTDCDLAYGCEIIGDFYRKMSEDAGTHVLIGSRTLHPEGYEGYTVTRRFVSKAYIKVLCVVGGLTLSDSQSGIKGFRRDAAKKIFSLTEVDRFAFDFEAILIAKKLGMKIAEHPVRIINHRASKVSVLRDAPKMVKDLVKMKRRINKLKP